MPVLVGEKRSGTISTRIGKNGIILREQSHYYTVQADSKYQDRAEIILCNGLPRYGVVYTDGLAVKSINADRDPDDAWRWHVTVVGSTEVEEDSQSNNQNNGNTSSDPTTWVPIASVKFEPYDEVLRADVNGKKWVNSAKKAFETGFVRQRRIAVVPFSQFEPISTKLETLMDRCDTINSVVYKGKAIHTLLLNVENATIGTYSGTRCWRVDYTMRYKSDDWRIKQLDVGWGYYDSGTFKPFLDSEGNQYLGSLNGSGAKVTNPATDDPATLYFDQYEELDFNSFLKVLFT
jgi:hypothetical protein